MNDPRPNQPAGIHPPQHGAGHAQPVRPPQLPHAAHAPVAHAPHPGARPGIAPMPVQPISDDESALDPIGLVEEVSTDTAAPGGASKIKAFGVQGAHKQREWKRKVNANGHGSCRVRTFHGKLSDQAMAFLDDQINEWLDSHPDVEVKFVTSTVGVFEGKMREPALILNLWY